MKIEITKKIALKICETENIRHTFSNFDKYLISKIKNFTIIPTDTEGLRKYAANIAAGTKTKYSTDELMLMFMIRDTMAPEALKDPHAADYYLHEIIKSSKVFDPSELTQDPYFRDIKVPEQRVGDFELHYMDLKPYELFIYNTDQNIVPDIYISVPCIGCFTGKVSYPAISQISTDSTWMSVTPNEIYTMKKPIDNASGKVLTLGCGMGYFTYIASLKEDVASITVIEKEQDVIDIFSEYILPRFRHKEKINIIKADAIEYMRSVKDGEFNYCFADIWQGIADIVPYFAVKEIGRNFRRTKIDYWIEDGFAIYISGFIRYEIMESFFRANHMDLSDMPEYKDEISARIGKYVHNLLKKAEIRTPEHISYYMDLKNIISMINRTDVIF